jgi:hypothetical protein
MSNDNANAELWTLDLNTQMFEKSEVGRLSLRDQLSYKALVL